jgi:hypothetical protein
MKEHAMTSLQTAFVSLALCTVSIASVFSTCRAAEDPMSIDALAPLIGQWRIESKWLGSDEPLKARLACEWGPGRKFVICRTFVTPNDGSPEYERYHEVFGIEDGKLIDHGFVVDGKSYVREFRLDGNVLKSQWKIPNSDPVTTARQELEIARGDTLQWRVWLEREGEKAQQIMDGTWVKDQAARTPSK